VARPNRHAPTRFRFGSQFLGRLGECPGKRSTDVFRIEDLSGKAVKRSGAAAPIRAGKDGSGMKESNGG
jgi:hypothetical protein